MAYTSFDPDYANAALVLSGGNLIVTHDGTTDAVAARAREGKTSGKWCFRATIGQVTSPGALFASINIGITTYEFYNYARLGAYDFSQPIGVCRQGLAISSKGQYFGTNIGDGYASGSTAVWANGDIVDVAVDIDNRLMWARLTPLIGSVGLWNGDVAADPSTGVGGRPFEESGAASHTLGYRLWPAVSLEYPGDNITVDFAPGSLIAELTGYSGWTQTYTYHGSLLYQGYNTLLGGTMWVGSFTPATDMTIGSMLVDMMATSATRGTPVIYAADGAGGEPGTLIGSGLVQSSGMAAPGFLLSFSDGIPLTGGTPYWVGYVMNVDQTASAGAGPAALATGYQTPAGVVSPLSIPSTFPTPTASASGFAPAVELLLAPPASLCLDNVRVDGLALESACTIASLGAAPAAGSGPICALRWSDTRGATWGNAIAQEFTADPYTQLQWNRLGMARDRVFEIYWSAGLKTAINGAFVNVAPLKS